jgi:mxaA protein
MVIFFVSLCWLHSASALEATVSLDRTLGLQVGDEITATVTLPVPNTQIDSHSLPASEKRQGPWLVLHTSEFKDENTFKLHYQLINVPAENRVVETPEMQLRTLDGAFIDIPPVNIQIGSFLVLREEGYTPLDDAALPELDQSLAKRELFISVVLLIVVGLIWFIWHFGFHPRKRLPFATAMFELNKMRWLNRKDDEAASRILHKAFNDSVGQVIIHSQLESLWETCPWLNDLETEIAAFYQTSTAYYFSPNPANNASFDTLYDLTKACRKREMMA